jgi:hypothetical protein
MDEWIKKMQYIDTVKYYSAIKKTEILLFAGKWVELKIIMHVYVHAYILR